MVDAIQSGEQRPGSSFIPNVERDRTNVRLQSGARCVEPFARPPGYDQLRAFRQGCLRSRQPYAGATAKNHYGLVFKPHDAPFRGPHLRRLILAKLDAASQADRHPPDVHIVHSFDFRRGRVFEVFNALVTK
jgi:hypothetical protein